MIRIEQIRELESKIHAAVERIRTLTAENDRLKENLVGYEDRLAELQRQVEAFRSDQDAIEAGIVSALQHLDQLEDGVGDSTEPEQSGTLSSEPSSLADEPAAGEVVATQPPAATMKSTVSDEPETSSPDTSVRNDSPTRKQRAQRTAEPEEPEVVIGDEEEEPELDIF